MILRDKICWKAHALFHLFFVTILTMSLGTVYGADNLQKQALELANKEVDKYIVLCGKTWYGYQIGNKYIEMRRRAVPRIEVNKISESDKLNGFEWGGRIVYSFGPSRRGYLQKNGAMEWKEWQDYGERFTVSSNRKNGQWIMSAGNFKDPSYWESWEQRSNWFSSCSALSGRGAKDSVVGASTGGHESSGSSSGTTMGAWKEPDTADIKKAKKELSKYINLKQEAASEEDEKKWLLTERDRITSLPYSSELLQLKRDRSNAVSRDNAKSIIELSHKILQIDPADYLSFDYLANLYTRVGEPDKALVYAAEILKKGAFWGRTFALIAQAYAVKEDINNTLLWEEKTLQSKYPYYLSEAALNQIFPEDKVKITQVFNKYRAGANTASPETSQKQPNVVEGVSSMFKSFFGGAKPAPPKQDVAATPSKTSPAMAETPQASTSTASSAPPEKAAESASSILESVERRQKVFPPAPEYLYETSSFTGSVSSTWMEMTSGMLGTKGLRDKYEEFYLSAVEYRSLAQVQLSRAKRYAEKGDAETAEHFLKSADHYLKLFNLSSQGASDAYLGNIDAAAEVARGIYEGSKKAASFGGDALGPAGSRVVDIVFTATDFAVQASDVGVSQALKETIVDILTEAVLKSVPDSSLGGKTISEVITKKTTKAIGSSQVYGILKAATGSAKFSKAFTTLLAKSTASELNRLTKDKVAKIVLGLGGENPPIDNRVASGLSPPIKTTASTSLRLNGPAFDGMIASGQRVALTLRVADAPSCTPASSGKVECQVILYSGGRPNPGISMEVFRSEFALVIDEVDVTMELQTSGGEVISRSRTFAAGATPGYQQVIVATKLPPGEYQVVCTSGKRGRFSVLWSEPLGD